MIKNIVFDIGNVLAGYSPKKEVEEFGTRIERIEYINSIIIKEKNWTKYLNGLISLDDLLNYCNKLNKEYKLEIEILLKKENQKYIIYEIEKNTKLLKELSKKFNTYLLSNITKETYEYIMDDFSFKENVKGGIYSFKEHILKPCLGGIPPRTQKHRRLYAKAAEDHMCVGPFRAQQDSG